jgi:hypothetical protein
MIGSSNPARPFSPWHLRRVDHRSDHSAASRALLKGCDRAENRRIPDSKRSDGPNRRLRVMRVVDIAVVQRHQTSPAQSTIGVRLALDEAVDECVAEILGARPVRQGQSRRTDRVVDPVDIERVLHNGVPDPEVTGRALAVADEHDLRAIELHA